LCWINLEALGFYHLPQRKCLMMICLPCPLVLRQRVPTLDVTINLQNHQVAPDLDPGLQRESLAPVVAANIVAHRQDHPLLPDLVVALGPGATDLDLDHTTADLVPVLAREVIILAVALALGAIQATEEEFMTDAADSAEDITTEERTINQDSSHSKIIEGTIEEEEVTIEMVVISIVITVIIVAAAVHSTTADEDRVVASVEATSVISVTADTTEAAAETSPVTDLSVGKTTMTL